jgi:hypothetical protein
MAGVVFLSGAGLCLAWLVRSALTFKSTFLRPLWRMSDYSEYGTNSKSKPLAPDDSE